MESGLVFNGKHQAVYKVCMLMQAFILAIAFVQTANAQSVSATLRVDSNEIMIGDPVHVNLSVKYRKGTLVMLPNITDTIGNMEVSEASKLDTIIDGNNITLSRTYTVSAYDSGEYHAGPVHVLYKNSTGGTDTLFSNQEMVTVNTLDVDTSKPIKAIKAPLEVPYKWQEFTYYIIGGVGLIIALIIGYLLWRRYRKNKPAMEERPRPKEPAHVWARKELKKLEEERLWQKDNVKQYYSRLTDILRFYLEYRYNWQAIESTTEEITAELPQYEINDIGKNLMLDTLRAADLVKFAKMMPAPDSNTKAMDNVKQFVEMTAQAEENNEAKNKK